MAPRRSGRRNASPYKKGDYIEVRRSVGHAGRLFFVYLWLVILCDKNSPGDYDDVTSWTCMFSCWLEKLYWHGVHITARRHMKHLRSWMNWSSHVVHVFFHDVNVFSCQRYFCRWLWYFSTNTRAKPSLANYSRSPPTAPRPNLSGLSHPPTAVVRMRTSPRRLSARSSTLKRRWTIADQNLRSPINHHVIHPLQRTATVMAVWMNLRHPNVKVDEVRLHRMIIPGHLHPRNARVMIPTSTVAVTVPIKSL